MMKGFTALDNNCYSHYRTIENLVFKSQRHYLVLLTALLLSNWSMAQLNHPIDVSPLDLAYYPHRYSENIKFDPQSNFG